MSFLPSLCLHLLSPHLHFFLHNALFVSILTLTIRLHQPFSVGSNYVHKVKASEGRVKAILKLTYWIIAWYCEKGEGDKKNYRLTVTIVSSCDSHEVVLWFPFIGCVVSAKCRSTGHTPHKCHYLQAAFPSQRALWLQSGRCLRPPNCTWR